MPRAVATPPLHPEIIGAHTEAPELALQITDFGSDIAKCMLGVGHQRCPCIGLCTATTCGATVIAFGDMRMLQAVLSAFSACAHAPRHVFVSLGV